MYLLYNLNIYFSTPLTTVLKLQLTSKQNIKTSGLLEVYIVIGICAHGILLQNITKSRPEVLEKNNYRKFKPVLKITPYRGLS